MTTMPQTPVNNDQRDWPNCLVCADLNVHYIAHGRFPRDPHEMNVGPRLEKFKNAALQGCDGCRVITWITEDYAKRCLPYVHDPSTEISVDMRSSTYQVPFRPNLIRLHYWRKQSADEESDKDDNWVGSPAFVHNLASFHHDGNKSWQVAELEVFRKEAININVFGDAILHGNRYGDSKSTTLGDERFLNQLRSWLQDCDDGHACAGALQPKLPTRVLDVGSMGSGVHPSLLCISSVPEASGRYMCLSYCWGNVQPIQTTSASIASHMRGIPMDKLPKTFQDAVHLARVLEVRYLWIDALCIVQDDVEDWKAEAGRMAEIYANSHLTISATASKDPTGGLFRLLPSDDSPMAERMIPDVIAGSMAAAGLCYRHRLDHYDLERSMAHQTSDVGFPAVTPSLSLPLLSRAWTLQESLLSRRIVHFTQWEVVWECLHGMKCMCRDQVESKYSVRTKYAQLTQPMPDANGYLLWHDIVDSYSSKHLTQATDRLVALSGVAKQAQAALKDDYLAGLWRCNIADDLIWFTWQQEPMPNLMPEDGVYIAPSWSWASVNRKVSFMCLHEGENRHLCDFEILEVHCTASDLDPTGAISDAYLLVFGAIAKCRLKDVNPSDGRYRITLDGTYEAITFWPDQPEMLLEIPSSPWYCLHMGGGGDVHREPPSLYSRDFFMILQKLQVGEECYRRVGFCGPQLFGLEKFMEVATLKEIVIF